MTQCQFFESDQCTKYRDGNKQIHTEDVYLDVYHYERVEYMNCYYLDVFNNIYFLMGKNLMLEKYRRRENGIHRKKSTKAKKLIG